MAARVEYDECPVSASIPPAVVRRGAQHFDAETLASGLALAIEGRVSLVRAEWPVVAQVGGYKGHVVTVHYVAATETMRGDCSCSERVDCAHAAAAFVVAGAGEASEDRLAAQKQEAVGEWLTRLSVETTKEESRETRQVVVYVFVLVEGALALTVQRTTRLMRGGFGRSSVLGALGDPSRGAPSWVPVEDLRRIALLRAVTGVGPLDTNMRLERMDGDLLHDVVHSKRLFYESVGTRPLQWGLPRRSELRWEVDAKTEEYRVGLGDSLILLPTRQCHYLDLIEGLVGPLDVGVAPAVVQHLLTAPPVPKAMLAVVTANLQRVLGEQSPLITTAQAGASKRASLPQMQPELRVMLDDATGNLEVVADALYDDDRFSLAAWDAQRPLVRDLAAEGQRRRRLDSLLAAAVRGSSGHRAQDVLAQARHLAHTVVPVLAEEGWRCVIDEDVPVEAPTLPEAWVERLEPLREDREWFRLELGVVIAGRTVSLLPILLDAIANGELPLDHPLIGTVALAGKNLRLPDGELVHISGERLERWLRPLIELQLRGLEKGNLEVPALIAAQLVENDSAGRFSHAAELAQARARLEQMVSLSAAQEPGSFAGTLRDYQRRGLAWLRLLHDSGYGGLLADEMGLGKTVQVLAFLESLRADGKLSSPALVIAPRSVVGHWRAEAQRFAASLAPVLHLGPGRARDAEALATASVVVTSYQTMLRDGEMLAGLKWSTLIFDEMQALKNPKTRLRKVAASLRAGSRIGITGTPIENRLRELWSQLDVVMPGLLGRKATFEAVFGRPVEKHADSRVLALLRQRIRPFLLRRTKRSVELELPDKVELIERVELGARQRDYYESLRASLDEDVRRALHSKGIQGSSLMILDALLKLRQCCCDPRLVKMPQAPAIRESAKLERLMSMLEELADSGRFVLVFSQFTTMLRLIARACDAAKLAYLELTGASRDRDEVVRRFQAGAAPVLLVSLKAGGLGLNLTRADTVIHYDPWWNPAAEDQATDRAHRIGQTRRVFVYRLVATGTLEERIVELQEQKRALMNAALAGGAGAIDASDLEALYRVLI